MEKSFHRRTPWVLAIMNLVYALFITYSANSYCFANAVQKPILKNGSMVKMLVKPSVFKSFFYGIKGMYLKFGGIDAQITFIGLLVGLLISGGIYLFTYLYFKQKEDNREGHEHGGAHLMRTDELIEYQKIHMSM